MDAMNRDNKISNWLEAKSKLDFYKAREMELRREITEYVLEVPDLTQFSEVRTSKLNLGNGYGLKATSVLNYTLDEISRVEGIIERMFELGKSEIAAKVFKWKPSLSESEYKKLDPEDKLIIDEVVTIKPGSPKVEFIEPKVK